MKKLSRVVKFIDTNAKQNHIGVLRDKNLIDQLDDNDTRGVGRGVSLGSGNPLQVQYIIQLGEVTPVILQMI